MDTSSTRQGWAEPDIQAANRTATAYTFSQDYAGCAFGRQFLAAMKHSVDIAWPEMGVA
jgi:hypothetical protein